MLARSSHSLNTSIGLDGGSGPEVLRPTYSSLGFSGHSFDLGRGMSSKPCKTVCFWNSERPAFGRGLMTMPRMPGSACRPEQLAV